jgi:hypothetical protein
VNQLQPVDAGHLKVTDQEAGLRLAGFQSREGFQWIGKHVRLIPCLGQKNADHFRQLD